MNQKSGLNNSEIAIITISNLMTVLFTFLGINSLDISAHLFFVNLTQHILIQAIALLSNLIKQNMFE